jgi:histidine triad (HIT) family protein
MSSDCLFCSIIAGEAPSTKVAEGDGLLAIRDIYPRAPVHVLVIPHQHLASAHELRAEHSDLLGRCFTLAQDIAEAEGIADGYRVATNIGTRGGQAIPHLHFHVLGGRQLGHIDSGEPPASAP